MNITDNVRHVDVNVNDSICNHCIVNYGVHGVSTALATSQGSSQAYYGVATRYVFRITCYAFHVCLHVQN